MAITAAEYQRRKLSGKCVRQGCNRDQAETSLLCGPHAADQRAYKRRYFKKPKGKRVVRRACRKWRRSMRDQDRCQDCGRKGLKTPSVCARCHGMRLARWRRRHPNPSRACSRCREIGHNVRTCAKPAPVSRLDQRLPALPPLRIDDFASRREAA